MLVHMSGHLSVIMSDPRGGAAVQVKGEGQWGIFALGGSPGESRSLRQTFLSHLLHPVRQEVDDLSEEGFGHTQLGKLVFQ